MNQKINAFSFTNERGAMIAAIFIIYLMKPYFIWTGFFGSVEVMSIVTLLLGVLFVRNFDRGTSGSFPLALSFVAIVMMYVLLNGYNLRFSLTFFPIALLPFATIDYQRNVYNNFLNVYTILLSVSLIVWVLVIVGVMPSLGTIAPLNALKSYNYQVYPLLVRSNDSFRFFGPFDEPGVIGTISGIILCIQKFNLNDRRNAIVFASGLCSLSFFFYALIAIYFLLYYMVEKKSIQSTIIYVIGLAIAVAIITNVPVLNEILGERFIWDSQSNSFAGENRTNDFAREYFDSIIGTHEFWWGVEDKEFYREMVAGSSSYINTIVFNGMVFFMSYCLFFILYAWRNKFSIGTFALFTLVLAATIYQRPFLFNAEFVFLWACLARFDNNEIPSYYE